MRANYYRVLLTKWKYLPLFRISSLHPDNLSFYKHFSVWVWKDETNSRFKRVSISRLRFLRKQFWTKKCQKNELKQRFRSVVLDVSSWRPTEQKNTSPGDQKFTIIFLRIREVLATQKWVATHLFRNTDLNNVSHFQICKNINEFMYWKEGEGDKMISSGFYISFQNITSLYP